MTQFARVMSRLDNKVSVYNIMWQCHCVDIYIGESGVIFITDYFLSKMKGITQK